MAECQEPGCRHQALVDYKGRHLCSDCYQKYKDIEERQFKDFAFD